MVNMSWSIPKALSTTSLNSPVMMVILVTSMMSIFAPMDYGKSLQPMLDVLVSKSDMSMFYAIYLSQCNIHTKWNHG